MERCMGIRTRTFQSFKKKEKKMVPKKSGAMKPSENFPLGSSRDFPYGQKLCATLVLVRVCLFPASKLESPNVNKAAPEFLCPATVTGLWISVSTKSSPRTLTKLLLLAIEEERQREMKIASCLSSWTGSLYLYCKFSF